LKTFIYDNALSSDEYRQIQVERSHIKFQYCRVSILDAVVIVNILKNNGFSSGPLLCMGVRNGREVDLFRTALFSPRIAKLSYLFEQKKFGYTSMFPWIERFGRSDIGKLQFNGVYGCALNSQAKRKDIHIGSFDDLPETFSNTFEVVYSNSFDQAIDPEKTAKEWLKVLKPSGFVVLNFVENDEPTYTDPTGGITVEDVCRLFPGNVIQLSRRGALDTQGTSTSIIIKHSN